MSNRRIANEVIDEVLKRSNIVDVVGKYVHLVKQGHYMKGLCPFHSEKTPSFTVTPEKQIYYCYGCHAGGNVVHFLMGLENLSYIEAIRQLADDVGIVIDADVTDEGETKEQKEIAVLYSAYELTTKWYHYILCHTEQGRPAVDYLRQRQMNDKLISTFQLGFAPTMWDTLAQFLQKREFPLALMEKGGLISPRNEGNGYFDKFRERVMFPIYDHRGRVIAFGGRAIGSAQPKYMNSPETPLFNKSRQLFNIHLAKSSIRSTQTVILFEGYMDVIKAWEAEVTNGVATMGTALTGDHVRQLARLASEVIVCYDGDSAGQAAAYKSIGLLEKEGLHVKIAYLPNEMDPDEYITVYGAKKFHDILDNALSTIEFKLLYIRKDFDMQATDGRLLYLDAALKIVAGLQSPVEREHYIKQLSGEFPYSPDVMKQQMNQFRQQLLKKNNDGDNLAQQWNNGINNGHKRELLPVLRPKHLNAEAMLLCAMMHNAEVAAYVSEKLGESFNDEDHAALSAYLYAYYASGNEPDISRYIGTLQDTRLESVASFISLQHARLDLSTEVLDDLIYEVIKYPKQQKVEAMRNEFKQLERSGDFLNAAKIAQEILNIEKTILGRRE